MDIKDGRINALIADLDSHDKPAIRAAVDALIPIAIGSAPIRQILERRLLEAGHRNYWPVAYVLGHLSPLSAACLGTLIDALDHREPDIRWAMALLLVRVAKQEIAVIDLLINLAATGTANQKRMALYCIRDLGLSDAASLAGMMKALEDADPTVRVAAAISLKPRSDMDDAAREVLLRIYLNDKDARVRHTAAVTLASLGAASADFLEALKDGSGSPDAPTRKAAVTALEILKKRRPAPTAGKCDA
jgi:hypothetical protein